MATFDEEPTPPLDSVRFWALALAVVHHGLACLAEKAVPSRANTVTATADEFEDWLNEVPTDDNKRGRR